MSSWKGYYRNHKLGCSRKKMTEEEVKKKLPLASQNALAENPIEKLMSQTHASLREIKAKVLPDVYFWCQL